MVNGLFALFHEYMGTGLITIWFLISVVYLLINEKRKDIKIVFVYVPLIVLLIFFNPLFAGIAYTYLDGGIYYRLLWLLPVTLVIAYTIVNIYGRLSGKMKYIFASAAVITIIFSGKLIYADPQFGFAENMYHVPSQVVDICNAIEVEGREVTAVFPAELMQYVRQYSETVCMPYGRELMVGSWDSWNNLYGIMESDAPDAKELANEARSQGCIYIILPEDKKTIGSLSAYGYDEFERVDGYIIYMDNRANLQL